MRQHARPEMRSGTDHWSFSSSHSLNCSARWGKARRTRGVDREGAPLDRHWRARSSDPFSLRRRIRSSTCPQGFPRWCNGADRSAGPVCCFRGRRVCRGRWGGHPQTPDTVRLGHVSLRTTLLDTTLELRRAGLTYRKRHRFTLYDGTGDVLRDEAVQLRCSTLTECERDAGFGATDWGGDPLSFRVAPPGGRAGRRRRWNAARWLRGRERVPVRAERGRANECACDG